MKLFAALILLSFSNIKASPPRHFSESTLHQFWNQSFNIIKSSEEQTSEHWNNIGENHVISKIREEINKNKAKNVIFFIGDGMSIGTLAASRIYKGQLAGFTGEEEQLSFEKFPVTGLAKTYCVNTQVPDSACTATAYHTGVKVNYGTLGVTAKVQRNDCENMVNTDYHVKSVANAFMDSGRSAGIVTTTRVTHASPAGSYGHSAERDWENDAEVISDGKDPEKCIDLAKQLVFGETGSRFKVILGGGRSDFLPSTSIDEENIKGKRKDNRNLINEWKTNKENLNSNYEYVWNREQLLNVSKNTDTLLGLFEGSHCKYHLEANLTTEPTFEEMVEKAIEVLSKNENGFYLFAEGGRIDHAHHDSQSKIALDETVEFAKAIEKAVQMTNRNDTLIVVSSDHGHVLSFSGYSRRGNPILGPSDTTAKDKLKYLTLNYANGLGYRKETDGNRVDVTLEDIDDIFFKHPSMVPLGSETHSGEDVAVFALGPWQHLYTGIYEQNVIPQIMVYASCIEKGFSACENNPNSK